MVFGQIFSSLKKSKLLLLLLAVFFLKQLLFVAVFPIFQGPDETIHYSRIQYLAEPKEKTWDIKNPDPLKKVDLKDISTRNFSEELTNTAKIVEFDEIAFHSSNINNFSNTPEGFHEENIKNSGWKKYIENSEITLKKWTIAYYTANSLIEKRLSNFDIFTRFFAERIFSALLGLLIVLLTYLIAGKIGWDKKVSILLATLVAFQPMFSQAAAIINYDILLILAFSLFTYGAVSLLAERRSWKNFFIIFLAIVLGLLTKAPSLILVVIALLLPLYLLKEKIKLLNRNVLLLGLIIAFLGLVAAFNLFFSGYVDLLFKKISNSKFDSLFRSLSEYVSITLDRCDWSELSYWGNFGWLDANIPSWIVDLAHCVEIAAILGIIAYFIFPKKIPDFLPQKKFVILLGGLFLGLEFIIRFADWMYFNSSGRVQLGTPGRYFLPVITAQFILIATGLGMLARKYSIWKNILKVLSLSMILLWIYSVLIIIIPRYYL